MLFSWVQNTIIQKLKTLETFLILKKNLVIFMPRGKFQGPSPFCPDSSLPRTHTHKHSATHHQRGSITSRATIFNLTNGVPGISYSWFVLTNGKESTGHPGEKSSHSALTVWFVVLDDVYWGCQAFSTSCTSLVEFPAFLYLKQRFINSRLPHFDSFVWQPF